MRAVVQRVSSAAVTTVERGAEREVGRIGMGLLVLVGIERDDASLDVRYIADKIEHLRVFEDPADPDRGLNRSVADVGGSLLVISQFTLSGDCRKGRRPSFDGAASPDTAKPLYEEVVAELKAAGLPVETGEFRATMRVALVNEGPVTLLLDSRKRF
jgi:D-tyrosyl-tRNA(Tyr) deacylase